MDRLTLACKGKSASQGGMNVPDLIKLAKERGYKGSNTRTELLKFLCHKAPNQSKHSKHSKHLNQPNRALSTDRLSLACQGKSASQGGLNVSELTKLAKAKGYTGTLKRKDVLNFLCQANGSKPVKMTKTVKTVKAVPVKPNKAVHAVAPGTKHHIPTHGLGPINPVPGTKTLSNDRKKDLNKNQLVKEAYIDILNKYGITFGFPLLGSGTFSDVYDLGNGTVLRIEPGPLTFNKYGEERDRVNQYLVKNPHDIFPRIYAAELRKGLIDKKHSNNGWVTAVVMEKLDLEDWKNWKKSFNTPEALIKALKIATAKMHATGLIHTDISMNNVVLTKKGEIMFIDIDESCYIPGCNKSPGRTPGFQAPEWALYGFGSIKGNEKKVMLDIIRQWGIDPGTLPKATDFQKGKYDQHIMDNSIYGMGVLAHWLITDQDPKDGYDIKKVHPHILPMIHPDPRKRSLQ